ncbi:MAG: cyclic nucleotide-binding domain-containing protein [Bacillati bacterium ANGP1]|uniref:Cyclic nucleotide-binding domain-containing protein n=1 Tax=Candidatus Segetimicrobium genomatis TaxID=2569760 RepID=A0A537KDV7_9BACT|nr:MAG: cyclic nucleotide-binding domain-containing protein [Terrabacteria group bacterium ANGP1]
MPDVRRQGFGEVSPGDHLIFIYEDPAELTAFAVPFINGGLAGGERCLYVVDDPELPEITEALAAGGVDVDRESRRGALVFMNGEEYAGPPPFDPLRLVELLRRRVTEAGSRGFTGLRIAGQMTWTLEAGVPDRALVEYEVLVERATGPGPLTAACMYQRDRFDQAVLLQLVRSHPKVVAGDHVYLSLSALFHNLARADLQALARSARERHVPKGGFFFHQGDPAPEVYMLMSGKVKLVRTDSDGRSVILRIVNPMEPFGERGLLGATARLGSAQALDDARALVWDGPKILQAIISHPAVSLNAIRLLEERVETERSRLQDLATSGVERRLARLLLRLAQSIGRPTVRGLAIDVSLSGQDLAELVIATPYTVSRILADWRRLGIADAHRERILLLDLKQMAAVAGLRDQGDLTKIGGGGVPLET